MSDVSDAIERLRPFNSTTKDLDVIEASIVGERRIRIADLAMNLIGSRADALRWLVTANRALGGQAPLVMIETEIGCRAVEQALYAIAYGGVA